MLRMSVAVLLVLGLAAACDGVGDLEILEEATSSLPEGAIEVGEFFVVRDEGFAFDEFPLVCDAETADDGTLLAGTPFESRRFPDGTRVYFCKEDGHVTAAVVRSSPAFLHREFMGAPVVEFGAGADGEFSELEVEGLTALVAVWESVEVPGHDTAIYVIEQSPEGDTPDRMAELRYVSSVGNAICFMRQILDFDPPGPCPP